MRPFSTFLIMSIFWLLPSFGDSLSTRSNTNNPSDPCLVFANQCDAIMNTNIATSTFGASCPRYNPDLLGGRVCLGCFRDDFEIENWDRMSFAEKAYALEDASDRAQAMKVLEDDDEAGELLQASLSLDNLKQQALLWRSLTENESTLEAFHHDTDDLSKNVDIMGLNQDDNNKSPDIEGNNSHSTFAIPSVVALSTNMPTNSKASTSVTKAETVEKVKTDSSGRTKGRQKDESLRQEKEFEHQLEPEKGQSPPPPTPCTRICRYNADCYDGKVCIGCFRDTHDIAQWSSMSPIEKMFSLEDAADRCKDLSERGKDTETCYEGGITEAALRDQATHWGNWKG